MLPNLRLLGLVIFLVALAPARATETVRLTELDLKNLHFAGWKKPQIDMPAGAKPLAIAGHEFAHGLATYATTTLWLALDGRVERFQASVGVDDAAADPKAAVVFTLFGDDRKLWESAVLKRGEPAVPVDVELKGVHSLLLKVDHGGDDVAYDYADWAAARFVCAGERPRTVVTPSEPAIVLTPKPPAEPRINGPVVYGCRPGHPFIYRIPTTGERPMKFTADALPASLHLDPVNGLLIGTAPERGTYVVTLNAQNRLGTAHHAFKIVSGETLALTPPMGWNHWYAHYRRITDEKVREAADTLVASGMADVGYAYVNIDDCWADTARNPAGKGDALRVGPYRDADGNLIPNRHFPDMPALTAYIHAKGLKAGIYSSPGPTTCAGYAGSYQHEAQDARQFAAWGFDFLKYDWCSYRNVTRGDDSLAALQQPYQLMGGLVRQLPRDMVFNLCQYGMGNVWEWGAEVGGQCWRTSRDLGGELNRICDVALKNAEHARWSKPGAWNDPDYIQIGYVGDAHGGGLPQPCPLTPTEQYSFMSLWSLMAAPLVYSGDMSQLDEFTLNVLCNPEVIAIDQDPLGECARVVRLTPDTFLMIKNLEDGSKALGLCNRGEISTEVRASWASVGVTGRQSVHDVWRQRASGAVDGEIKATVPRHGVLLLRLASAVKTP
jgi:alpha-galactosidase